VKTAPVNSTPNGLRHGRQLPAMVRLMDPLHATLEEFAAEGYSHVECFCPRCAASYGATGSPLLASWGIAMRRVILVAVVLFSMLDRPAAAGHFVDGNALFSNCKEEATANSPAATFMLVAYCQGYIIGIADGAVSRFCLPDKVQTQQLTSCSVLPSRSP
jgi:hypothetical protein